MHPDAPLDGADLDDALRRMAVRRVVLDAVRERCGTIAQIADRVGCNWKEVAIVLDSATASVRCGPHGIYEWRDVDAELRVIEAANRRRRADWKRRGWL
jgi:predicted methyltransferase MtxX (methanogen marker protein 4)